MLSFALAMAGFASELAGPVGIHVMDVRLIAETSTPRPGRTVLVGFAMDPKPGWHGYWSNPGGSGIPPTVKWTAPESVHFGKLLHPAPTLMRSMGLVSFVHAGRHVLLSRMSLDKSVARGTALPLTAEISWAACSDKLCVPEHASLSLSMTVGDGDPSADAAILHQALHDVPATVAAGQYSVDRRRLVLQFPTAAVLNPASARFYPEDNGYLDPVAERVIAGLPLRITAPLIGRVPEQITGVVSDATSAYRLTLTRSDVRPPAETQKFEATPSDTTLPVSPRPTTAATRQPDQRVSQVRTSEYPWLTVMLVLAGLLIFGVGGLAFTRRSNRRS